MNSIDGQAESGIGREDIFGRLALADGKTKHLHLAIEAGHTTDPTKSKALGRNENERKKYVYRSSYQWQKLLRFQLAFRLPKRKWI